MLTVAWWMFGISIALACAGCGVDEDALICAPGHERDGNRCVDIVPESDAVADGDAAAHGDVFGAFCTSLGDCQPSEYCGDTGRCTRRCDRRAGVRCIDDEVCTIAGVCQTPGSLQLGAECEPATDACAAQFVCAASSPDDSVGTCRLICDPRAPRCTSTTERCTVLPSGFGACVPNG